jgi:predicted ATPase
MLETVREYALARLAASGEFEACAERHADWYLHLAERVPSTQLDSNQAPLWSGSTSTARWRCPTGGLPCSRRSKAAGHSLKPRLS